MTYEQFVNCTWREFLLRFDGYQLRRAHETEGPRAIWHLLLRVNWNTDKYGPCPDIHKAWQLISDSEQVQQMISDDDAEYRLIRAKLDAAKNVLLN